MFPKHVITDTLPHSLVKNYPATLHILNFLMTLLEREELAAPNSSNKSLALFCVWTHLSKVSSLRNVQSVQDFGVKSFNSQNDI